jgi:hypothetical protein
MLCQIEAEKPKKRKNETLVTFHKKEKKIIPKLVKLIEAEGSKKEKIKC